MRRLFLITALILIVLPVVTAGVAYYLLNDEAFVKSQLSSQTLKYTGRELTLTGPVQLTLGRVTTLEAEDIHFANAAWAEEPDMASVGHLKISIDLSSLFSEQIVFPALSLEDCKVSLTRNDEGVPSWDMGPQSEPDPGPPSPPRDKLPVVFRDLQLRNCEVFLASLNLEEPLDIKVSGLEMQHLENGRWQGKGSGSVNKDPFSLDGWFVPFHALILGGPLEHDLDISLGDLTAQSSGSVQDAKTWEGANLTTKIQGPDIEKFLREFKLPPFSEGPFDCQLKLNTEGKMTKLDLNGDLGSVDIKASGELDRLRRPRDGNIQFSIDGPNLGALARVFGVEGLVEEAFSHISHAEFNDETIHIRKTDLKTDLDHLQIGGHFNTSPGFAGTELDIDFKSDEAGRWTTAFGQPQQKLGALELNSKLAIDSNALISIDARAEQDTTNLDVKGTLGSLPDSIQLDLNIAFKSSDPSHLAAIAGWELVPATPLTIKGRFGYNGKQIQLGKVHVDLAGDRTDIDGMINLADHYTGSKLNLQMDVKNAGNLGRLFGREDFPEQPVQLGAEVRPEGKGLAFKVTDGNLGDIQLELDGRIPDLEKPLLMDGNFDIDLPRLNDLTIFFPKIKLPDAPFSAHGKLKSKDNAVQFDNVIFDLAGDRATINGLLKLENRYAGSDLHAEMDIKNIAALGRLFGREGLPEQPTKLIAEVKPDGKGMAFEVHDSALGAIKLDLQGKIADMAKPLVMDADFEIQLPTLSAIDMLVPQMKLPDAPFSARGKLQSGDDGVQINNVMVDLAGDRAKINGLLKLENRFAGSDLAAEFDVKSAAALGRLFGQEGLPDEPFKLTAGVKPNGKGMAFELHDGDLRDLEIDLQGQIADMEHPLVMDASFNIQLPRLSEIAFLFPDKSLPEVPFNAKGRLKNLKTSTQLDQVQVTLGRIKTNIDGDLLPDNRFQLIIQASGPDASELDDLAGTPFPAKPFTLKTRLAGSPSEFDLKGLNLELGKSRVTGDLKIGLGDVTQIKGKIHSPYLDASHWYPGSEAKEETAPASDSGKKQWMFDDTPVVVFEDHSLDLDLDLQINQLFLGNTNIDGIKLELLLSKRLLEIKPFTFKGQQGGSFNGEFSLNGARGTPKLHLDVRGNDVRIGLVALPEQDPSTYPPLDLELSLDGAGATNRELASSLDGRYRAYMGSGQLASAGVQLLFSDFLTELLNTLNPFAETSKYTQLDCAVLAADVVSGQVEFIPSIAHTADITVFSQGAVDLKTEKIDITFNTKPRKGIGLTAGTLINSFIKVGGRLTAPAIEIDPAETIKSGGLAVVTLGISVLAKSASDRFLSSPDPCGDARKELAKRDSAAN
jgi:uncharacterized protein involved in outer membrane biogenesis